MPGKFAADYWPTPNLSTTKLINDDYCTMEWRYLLSANNHWFISL